MSINIITGLRRSGTSMLMLACKEAGLKIVGEKYSKNIKDSAVEGNPNGYWEVDGVTTGNGVRSDLDGDVVKVMMEALPYSSPDKIGKVVIIMRKPSKVLSSILKHNKIEKIEPFILKNLFDMLDTVGFLMLNKKQFIVMFYEDIIKNPRKEMRKLCNFIGGDATKATKAIDKKLDRSQGYTGQSIALKTWNEIYDHAKKGYLINIIKMEDRLKRLSKLIV